MRICSFGCSRYKAFREPVSVELRPLTLFFGKNSSGKSALLRLIRLLLRATSGRLHQGFPLDVDGLSYSAEFVDLVHGRLSHGNVDFFLELAQGNRRFKLDATVQNVLGTPFDRPVLSRTHFHTESLSFRWEGKPSGGSTPFESDRVLSAGLWPQEWMLSSSPSTDLQNQVDDWRSKIAQTEDCLTHLGPLRAQSEVVYKPKPPVTLSFHGAGFVNWLAGDSELLRQVGEWFATHLNGWRLALDVSGPMVECVLRKGDVSINMANAGQGMQQVLPVVVLQLAHQTQSSAPFLDLVEEPESSLHTAAQAALGDLFLETAKLGRGQLLVETHSENLLLRIRRRIAEGTANPEWVALYWIEDFPEGFSGLQRIHILPDGNVDGWPDGVFAEDYEEVRALRRAQKEKEG